MTREEIEGLIEEWAPRLGLSHWRIRVDWEKPSKKETWAEFSTEEDYDVAVLRCEPGYEKWTPEQARLTIVHELVHLVMRDLQVGVEMLHPLLETQTRRLARAYFRHELEAVVERVATSLVALVPPPSGGLNQLL